MLPRLLSGDQLARLLHLLPDASTNAGVRLAGNPRLEDWLRAEALAASVESILGLRARPVRAILFNKTRDANWALSWHQDRTIAVRQRANIEGFGPWTVKAGIIHTEPPFPLIETMLTARVHIDVADDAGAPLIVAPGSHRKGRIREADIKATVEECGTAACLAQPGDVWLYRTAILHASAPMQREGTRRVLQVDFSAEDLPFPLEWLGIGRP